MESYEDGRWLLYGNGLMKFENIGKISWNHTNYVVVTYSLEHPVPTLPTYICLFVEMRLLMFGVFFASPEYENRANM